MEATGVLPFVRGVDLSGNDFKVSCGEREGRPLRRLSRPLPLRFRDRRAGRAGLRESSRACPARGGRPGLGLPGSGAARDLSPQAANLTPCHRGNTP